MKVRRTFYFLLAIALVGIFPAESRAEDATTNAKAFCWWCEEAMVGEYPAGASFCGSFTAGEGWSGCRQQSEYVCSIVPYASCCAGPWCEGSMVAFTDEIRLYRSKPGLALTSAGGIAASRAACGRSVAVMAFAFAPSTSVWGPVVERAVNDFLRVEVGISPIALNTLRGPLSHPARG